MEEQITLEGMTKNRESENIKRASALIKEHRFVPVELVPHPISRVGSPSDGGIKYLISYQSVEDITSNYIDLAYFYPKGTVRTWGDFETEYYEEDRWIGSRWNELINDEHHKVTAWMPAPEVFISKTDLEKIEEIKKRRRNVI